MSGMRLSCVVVHRVKWVQRNGRGPGGEGAGLRKRVDLGAQLNDRLRPLGKHDLGPDQPDNLYPRLWPLVRLHGPPTFLVPGFLRGRRDGRAEPRSFGRGLKRRGRRAKDGVGHGEGNEFAFEAVVRDAQDRFVLQGKGVISDEDGLQERDVRDEIETRLDASDDRSRPRAVLFRNARTAWFDEDCLSRRRFRTGSVKSTLPTLTPLISSSPPSPPPPGSSSEPCSSTRNGSSSRNASGGGLG